MSDQTWQPTPSEARSRQTAMEAERHFWASKLRQLSADCRMRANENRELWAWEAFLKVANTLDALIAERERP